MGSKHRKQQKKTKPSCSKDLPGTRCSQPQESEFQDQTQHNTNPMSLDISEQTEQIERHHVCLLYGKPNGEEKMILLVIDASKDGVLAQESFSTVELVYWRDGIGFGSLGSKCYVIGGDVCIDGPTDNDVTHMLPRHVHFCDLRNLSKGWVEGPELQGGKPRPIIVTVGHKLYALAGYSIMWGRNSTEILKNLFEVFEPETNVWRVLPEPPFIKSYENFEGRPKFLGHTVIGSVIYFKVAFSRKPNLFSFNVDTERWHEHCGGSKNRSCSPPEMDDIILHNLRVSDWYGRGDVVDYLLFQTYLHGLEKVTVFAYDLTCEMKDSKDVYSDDGIYFLDSEDDNGSVKSANSDVLIDISDSEDDNGSVKSANSSEYDQHEYTDYTTNEYTLIVNDKVLTVPVFGLTSATRIIPKHSRISFVAHLGGNLFSLVYCYRCLTYEKCLEYEVSERVSVCVFQASFIEFWNGTKFNNRYVVGDNVRELNWTGRTEDMGTLIAWCKVPNDGHQSRFRRPQYHCGSSYDSYVDRVAGGAIRYNNAYNSHVRHVDLPK